MTHKQRLALIYQPFPRVRYLTSSYPHGGTQISRQGMGIEIEGVQRPRGSRTREMSTDYSRRDLDADEEGELFCLQEKVKK